MRCDVLLCSKESSTIILFGPPSSTGATLVLQSGVETMPLAPVKSEGEIWSPPSPVVVSARGHLGSKSPPQLPVDMWRSSNGYSSWSDMVLMDSQETEELLLLGGMQSGRCGSLQGLSGGYGMMLIFRNEDLLVS